VKGDDISNDGDVEEHIPLKDERARGVVITEGGVSGTVGSVHCSSKGFFNKFLGGISSCRRTKGEKVTNNLADSVVNRFNHRIGSRGMGGDGLMFDTGFFEGVEELKTNEFGTTVMDTFPGSGVLGEPVAVACFLLFVVCLFNPPHLGHRPSYVV